MPAGGEKAESRGEKAESPEPKRRQMPAGGEKAESRGEKAESPEPKRRRVEESAVGHERKAAQERGPVKAPSPGRTFMASTHFCYKPERGDELLSLLAKKLANIDSNPGWYPGLTSMLMCKTKHHAITSLAVWEDEQAMIDQPPNLKEWVRTIDPFKAEEPVRRTGVVRIHFDSAGAEDCARGWATIHVLALKEDGGSGVVAVVEDCIQRGDLGALPGLVCLTVWQAREDGNMHIVTEYESGMKAVSAAGRFQLMLDKMDPFLAGHKSESVVLRMGAII